MQNFFLDKTDAIVFDRMRRKRHSSVYDQAGTISETEAESAIRHAENLITRIEMILEDPTHG